MGMSLKHVGAGVVVDNTTSNCRFCSRVFIISLDRADLELRIEIILEISSSLIEMALIDRIHSNQNHKF